jgi:hypothetical protein
MWRQLSIMHEQNVTENVQLLQQQFYELRMKSGSGVVDNISTVEQLANQLTDLGEIVSDQAVISKIMCSLPPSYRHMQSAWDSVPCHEQNIEYLTLRLLKEEARNRIQDSVDDEGEKAFFASGSGAGQKPLSLEEKKKQAARINQRCLL